MFLTKSEFLKDPKNILNVSFKQQYVIINCKCLHFKLLVY